MSASTIGGFQSAAYTSTTWLTPPKILNRLGPFDLDPCAAPEPRPWSTAARHITLPDDGLTADWCGRVWLNPPYSKHAANWLARMADHDYGTALIFARTDTTWFQDHVLNRATALFFLRGRIKFHLPDGSEGTDNGGAPSVLCAYGATDAMALAVSGLNGVYVPLLPAVAAPDADSGEVGS